ncbi:pyrF [Symbiodinium natans]|uniref:Orotidine 5'-phosphate decarboxylase n=1 Tax=Symbiodinium natans TaxID=878477 RepID=A0A812P298_9DINO|nr:pyrF [Symbiodinium natans]
MSFFEKLTQRAHDVNSLLCVGLDPHKAELEEDSAEAAFKFCQRLIEETKDLVAAYKPNAAFFEAYGVEGWAALQRTLAAIPEEIPIVLDAKRGDIGSTSEAYASSAFQTLKCDSVTVSPYLGGDGLQPFLKDPSRGVWVLCKTSNPGSQDIQALQLPSGEPLYVHVAKVCCLQWAKEHSNAGLVVGATDVEAMRVIREAVPEPCHGGPSACESNSPASQHCHSSRKNRPTIILEHHTGLSKQEPCNP